MRVGMRIVFVWVAVMGVLCAQTKKQIIRVGPDLKLPFSQAVKAGNFIYVAGAIATDESGRVSGDIKAQTKRVLDNIAPVLKAAGTNFESVVSVYVYLKSASDFQAMNEVYRGYFPKDPPGRTTVQTNLVLPEALIEISMVAAPKGADRRVIHPSGWLKSPRPYSYGIKSGDTLFLAGLVSRSGKDDSAISGDMKTQTRTVLENAGEILKAAGMTHADVVSSRVYITDTTMFQDMNAAYRPFFPKDPPARATVKTGLMGPQYSVEITLVAVRGPAREAILAPERRWFPGQAKSESQLRDPCRQPSLRLRHARNQRSEQIRHEGANARNAGEYRPRLEGCGVRLASCCRRNGVHHRC